MPNWIFEENVRPFLELCSDRLGYPLDDSDVVAIQHGLDATDVENDRWFSYPLVGEREATVTIAQDSGSSVVFIDIDGPEDVETFGSVLVTVMQSYRLIRGRAPYEERWRI